MTPGHHADRENIREAQTRIEVIRTFNNLVIVVVVVVVIVVVVVVFTMTLVTCCLKLLRRAILRATALYMWLDEGR